MRPMNADYACEKVSGPAGRNDKAVTGEMVEEQGRFRVRCQSVWGRQLHMTGEKTSVHKPLLSAQDVTDKGHDGHHPERFTDSDSDAHVLRESLRATFVEWSH